MTPFRFRRIRRSIGTQRPVAAAMGVNVRTLQRIETGAMGNPIPEKYADAIRVLEDKS